MKVIKGDLLQLAADGKFDIIIHGCNCFNTMGSGIAVQIARRFPDAATVDKMTAKGDRRKLGKITIASGQGNNCAFNIINAYTQFGHNSDIRPFDINALESAFNQIFVFFADLRIGYPMIGAGLGGGDWNEIAPVIDRALEGTDHTLVKYDANH